MPKLKLSEAIMLGSTVSDQRLSNDNFCTCLVGLGVWAFHPVRNEWPQDVLDEAQSHWPWLDKPVPGFQRGRFLVTRLCSWVIMGKITLEEAVDLIRAVEPQEPEQTTCDATVVQNCEDQYGVLCGKKCGPGSYVCADHQED